MPEKLTSTSSVMEGRGPYNKYVKLPAGGAAARKGNTKSETRPRRSTRHHRGLWLIARQKNSCSGAFRDPKPQVAYRRGTADCCISHRPTNERLQLVV